MKRYQIFKAIWLKQELVFYDGDSEYRDQSLIIMEQCLSIYKTLQDPGQDYEGCSIKLKEKVLNVTFHDDELLIFTEKCQDNSILFLIRDTTLSLLLSSTSKRPVLQKLIANLL